MYFTLIFCACTGVFCIIIIIIKQLQVIIFAGGHSNIGLAAARSAGPVPLPLLFYAFHWILRLVLKIKSIIR